MKVAKNGSSAAMEGREFEVGTLPIGSYFNYWSPRWPLDGTSVHVASGFLMGATPGRAIVLLTKETDENFGGDDDHLVRLIKVGEEISWALETPVEFVCVDEEIRASIDGARVYRDMKRTGIPLIPVVVVGMGEAQ